MDLDKELDKTKKEIFRFEALQEYFSDGSDELENEINRQWKETGKIDMNTDLMKDWHDFIKAKVEKGVKFTWVRLLSFPLNEYTKSEIYIFKKRVKYGINIMLINKEKFNTLKIDFKDFYLLDGKALLMNYGKSNEYLGCECDKNSEKYKGYKDLLINNSIPIKDYVF